MLAGPWVISSYMQLTLDFNLVSQSTNCTLLWCKRNDKMCKTFSRSGFKNKEHYHSTKAYFKFLCQLCDVKFPKQKNSDGCDQKLLRSAHIPSHMLVSAFLYRTVRRYFQSNRLPPPTNCCEKGCHNCVWIKYAEKLTETYRNSEWAKEEILSQITDPSLKAFLSLELKNKQPKS